MGNLRLERVNALVASEVGTALGRQLTGPTVIATVTGVSTTADLREATVRISTVPDSAAAWETVTATLPELQASLAERATMKRTPKLRLQPDRTAAAAARIDQALKQVR